MNILHHPQLVPLKLFLFFFHSTTTLVISFLPVFYLERGISATHIGWLMAVGPLASLIAQPFWGFMSDKYKTIKRILLICLIGMIITSILFFQMNSLLSFLIMGYLLFSFASPIGALGDSLTQKTANLTKRSFGSIRMWGSIGFAFTSVTSGWILTYIGVENLLFPLLFYAFAALFTLRFMSDAKASTKPVNVKDAFHLAKSPGLFFFLASIVFLSIAHRTNDSFMGIYIKEIGGNESIIGLAWFIGVITEAFVFATSGWWFRKYHELTFIMFAGIIYAIRFFLVSFITEPTQILWIQPLHGITFGIFYSAALQYVSKIVPEQLQATGHLLLITVFFGLSGIIGSLIGGAIIDLTNGQFLYKVISLCSIIGILNITLYHFFLAKRQMKQRISP